MSTFREEGFLSSDTDALVARCCSEYKEWIDLCESINRYCLGIAGRLAVNPTDRQQHIASALFLRMIALYEASYILTKRGMVPECKVILRSLMESLFSLRAIVRNTGLAETFYQQHIVIKYKALKKLLDANPGLVNPENAKLLAVLKEKKRRAKELSVEELSSKARLHDFYASAWPFFSWSVHSNILELGQMIGGKSDELVDYVALKPDITEPDRYFMTGVECIVTGLHSVNELFKLNEADKIEEWSNKYKALFKRR